MKRALLAGTLGTLAVAALGPLERRVLGRKPRFAPETLARNLARERLGLRLSDPAARVAGLAMRAAYGPGWGLVLGALPRALTRRPLLAGLVLGGLVDLFEERAFPLTGATRAPRKWPARERGLLRMQTLAFGLVSASAYAADRRLT